MINNVSAPAVTRSSELEPLNKGPAAQKFVAGQQEKELMKECREFEGILIANLWNEMETGVSLGDPATDPGFDTIEGFGIQAAALGIANAGGLGLARMLYQELAPHVTQPGGPNALNKQVSEGSTSNGRPSANGLYHIEKQRYGSVG